MVQSGDRAVGGQPFHLRRAVFTEVFGDSFDAFLGPVEQVHLQVRAGDLGQFDQFAGNQGRCVPVDRDDGVLGLQEGGGGRPLRPVGALDGPFPQQVVVGLAPALGDEPLAGGDAAVDAGLDAVACQQRLVSRVALGDLDLVAHTRRSRADGRKLVGQWSGSTVAPVGSTAQTLAS